jgi:DNA-directed RNA polymerase specialized sigma24 family protein
MPLPVPVPIRELIWQRWQRGQSAPQIADVLSLPPRTVRHLVQQFRSRGEAAIRPGSPPARAAE